MSYIVQKNFFRNFGIYDKVKIIMKNIIRLTETELVNLVKKVIKETEGELDIDDNEVVDVDERGVRIKNASADTVQSVLSEIPEGVFFIKIQNCESADFSNVDICSMLRLVMVTIINTPNNFEDIVDCEYSKIERGSKTHYEMGAVD